MEEIDEPPIEWRNRKSTRIGAIVIVLLVVVYSQLGFYTIRSTKNISLEKTILVWRNKGTQFFNSPQAYCGNIDNLRFISQSLNPGLRELNACVSVFQEIIVAKQILIKFSYWDWAYQQSLK